MKCNTKPYKKDEYYQGSHLFKHILRLDMETKIKNLSVQRTLIFKSIKITRGACDCLLTYH